MPASRINDPKHWRDRAEEMRALAQHMSDQGAKDVALGIAADYEKLARRAEQRTSGSESEPRS